MKTTILSLATMCMLVGGTTNLIKSQTTNQKSKKMETVKVKSNKDVVQGFFNAFGKGDMEGIVNSFHDDCVIVGIRDEERNGNQIYGTYKGKDGVRVFISNLGNAFDTKAFSVENVVGEETIVFANGKFTHIVKSTGKPFSSKWALMCVIKDDKILEYHFYEDSEKFSEANK